MIDGDPNLRNTRFPRWPIWLVEFGRVCTNFIGKVSTPFINQMGSSKWLMAVRLQLCSYFPWYIVFVCVRLPSLRSAIWFAFTWFWEEDLLIWEELSTALTHGDRVQLKMSPTISLCCMYQNHLFIVGIGPNLNKELKFIYRFDWSDRMCFYG